MAEQPTDDIAADIAGANRRVDAAYALLRDLSDGYEDYAPDVLTTVHALDSHDAKRLAPIIAACRRELESGGAVGSGVTLAKRVLALCAGRSAPMADAEPTLHRVVLTLCSLCLDGVGGWCHTPGCALIRRSGPDLSIRHSCAVETIDGATFDYDTLKRRASDG